MLSNAYFLAKFRFDTAENEPAKNLQNFAKKIAKFANFANPNEAQSQCRARRHATPAAEEAAVGTMALTVAVILARVFPRATSDQ